MALLTIFGILENMATVKVMLRNRTQKIIDFLSLLLALHYVSLQGFIR